MSGRNTLPVYAGVLTALLVGVGLALYFAQPTSPSQPDQLSSLPSSQPSQNDDRQTMLDNDLSLLQRMAEKLADVSDSKFAKTGVAAFGVLKEVFTTFKDLKSFSEQHQFLCMNPNQTIQTTFHRTGSIYGKYVNICNLYNPLLSAIGATAPGESLSTIQVDFGNLLFSFIELDNAIANDP